MKKITFAQAKKLISIQPTNWSKSQFSEIWLDKKQNEEVILVRGKEFNLFLDLDPDFTSGLIFYNSKTEWWQDLSIERKITLNLLDDIAPRGWKKDQIWSLEKVMVNESQKDSFKIIQDSPEGWESIVIKNFDCFENTIKIFQNYIDQKMFYCERVNNQISDLIIWNKVGNRYVGYFWWSTDMLGMKKLWGIHKTQASLGVQYFYSQALESNQGALNAHLLFGYDKKLLRHLYTIGPESTNT